MRFDQYYSLHQYAHHHFKLYFDRPMFLLYHVSMTSVRPVPFFKVNPEEIVTPHMFPGPDLILTSFSMNGISALPS